MARRFINRSMTVRPAAWALALALLTISGCDTAVAPELAETVRSARTALMDEYEGPIRPALQFREIRCRADGGRLVVFDQISVLSGVAFAMQGTNASGWSGGWSVSDLETDPEIVRFFSESPEAPCVQPA
jgi:hypothetical protein